MSENEQDVNCMDDISSAQIHIPNHDRFNGWEELITTCPNCGTAVEKCFGYDGYDLMLSCDSCGKTYPWVDAAVQKAVELITEDEGLNLLEKTLFSMDLKSLVLDNSKAISAANQIINRLAKVNENSLIPLIKIILKISSPTVRNKLVGLDIPVI